MSQPDTLEDLARRYVAILAESARQPSEIGKFMWRLDERQTLIGAMKRTARNQAEMDRAVAAAAIDAAP